MGKEEKLKEVQIEYMERYEQGEAPPLDELAAHYPDLRDELADFVLDFIAQEKAVERVELSDEEIADAMVVQRKSIAKALKPVGSFQELRAVAGKGLGALAKIVHLPMSVLDGLERGMIVLDSVPAKLFERLGRALGRAPAEIRALLQAGNRRLRPVHWRAEAAPKGRKRQGVSFEEALRASEEFRASEEEYRRDWLTEAEQG